MSDPEIQQDLRHPLAPSGTPADAGAAQSALLASPVFPPASPHTPAPAPAAPVPAAAAPAAGTVTQTLAAPAAGGPAPSLLAAALAAPTAPAPAPPQPARETEAPDAAVMPPPPAKRSSFPALRGRISRGRPTTKAVPAGKGVTVGLKIGSSQLAAAVVSNSPRPSLVASAREPLAPGVVVAGELKQPEALTDALQGFFARHRLPRRNVRIGLASDRVGVRIFERPQVQDPKQLVNAIRFRAHEALPIPIEEALLDYHLIDGGEGPGRVLLVVTYREVVERFRDACEAAQLEVVGADLEAFALLRAVLGHHEDGIPRRRAAAVVVSIGHDRSIVAVSDGRICEFTRVLDWGGEKLTQALATALKIPAEQAERAKRTLPLLGTTGQLDHEHQAASAALRRELQTFARELASTLKFYQGQSDSLGIGEIALTGGTSHMPGLAEELGRVIGVGTRVADPLARVETSEGFVEAQIGSLAGAIGLGIED